MFQKRIIKKHVKKKKQNNLKACYKKTIHNLSLVFSFSGIFS